jgi:hypothetical protein
MNTYIGAAHCVSLYKYVWIHTYTGTITSRIYLLKEGHTPLKYTYLKRDTHLENFLLLGDTV